MHNIIGVDISNDKLDAHSPAGEIHKQFANDLCDIARLVKWADNISVRLIVLKATGTDHCQLEKSLSVRRTPFHKFNPRQACRFA